MVCDLDHLKLRPNMDANKGLQPSHGPYRGVLAASRSGIGGSMQPVAGEPTAYESYPWTEDCLDAYPRRKGVQDQRWGERIRIAQGTLRERGIKWQ